jgi:uncharacterized protein (DUF1800 family)
VPQINPQTRRTQTSTPILHTLIVFLLSAQLALPSNLLSQMAATPTPDNQPGDAMHTAPSKSPHTTIPLTQDEKILHVLNRFTYGPRPGDLERVRTTGLQTWFTQQMSPNKIDDSALEARLASYPAMQLPLDQMMARYPTNAMIRADMNGRGSAIPRGEAEKAIYADQMSRAKNAKKNKNQTPAPNNNLNDQPLLSHEETAQITDLPPDKRFSALCKMRPPQLQQFRRSLTPEQREHLTDGFTPQQLEELAAFNRPEGVIVAEDTQTKLLRDIYSERQIQEIMVDFWLNHFNVYIRKSQQAPYYIASYERDKIRPFALSSFENLLLATATSAAMLNYLDNASSIGPHSNFALRPFNNQKKRPDGLNENYARELMELHTVGVSGGYTQHDVTEVAKVFTGWTVGKRPFGGEDIQPQFDPNKHEPGPKYVLGTVIKEDGQREGLEVLHILANSPKTALFISTKLAVRFVSDNPPPAMIDRMTKNFVATRGDIRKVLLTMVNSPEFFSRDNYRAKMKTPQDFVVSAVRASGATVASPGALVDVLADLGMPLYGMQTPNGYSMKAETWNNTAALIERMNFSVALASNRVAGVTTDWPSILGHSDTPLSPEAKASALEQTLLHVSVSDRTRQTIYAQIAADPAQREASLRQVAMKDRRRDPLAVVPRTRQDGDLANIDSESALAAGLLFGSPEFQRR